MCKANMKVGEIPAYFALAYALSVLNWRRICEKHAKPAENMQTFPGKCMDIALIVWILNWRKDVEGFHETFFLFVCYKERLSLKKTT